MIELSPEGLGLIVGLAIFLTIGIVGIKFVDYNKKVDLIFWRKRK